MEKKGNNPNEKPYESDPNPKGNDEKGHNGSNGNHGHPVNPPSAHSLICDPASIIDMISLTVPCESGLLCDMK